MAEKKEQNPLAGKSPEYLEGYKDALDQFQESFPGGGFYEGLNSSRQNLNAAITESKGGSTRKAKTSTKSSK